MVEKVISMTRKPDNPKANLPARSHPDDRAKIEALSRLFQGSPERPISSYYVPELIQCTLPHSDPKVRDWKKSNGNFTLIVSSGVNDNLEPYDIPYGSFPRLVLAYIITQVVRNGGRRVELSTTFGSFLKEIGYTGNLRGSTRASNTIHNQLLRLLRASMTFEYREGDDMRGGYAAQDVKLSSRFALWWDYRQPEQGTLFESFIDISEEFHNAILNAPVPLRTDILAALKKSPLALDVYMWVSYRLFTMQSAGQEQVTLGYGRLQEQFGTGISEDNYRSFRRELKLAFKKVAQYWASPDGEKQYMNYELHETGLTLYRSPLLINVPKKKTDKDVTPVITNREFDSMTLKQARIIAGNWDVKYLSTQYFLWIEQKGIVPKDPRSHFLNFIKSHRKRHGEAP